MRKVKLLPGDEAAFRIAYLCAGFVRNTLTEKEEQELDNWLAKARYGGTWLPRTIRKLFSR